jgi:hypothetical protein
MPKTEATSVQDLHLDLDNFRSVAQPSEIQAIQSMILVEPIKFWALMESLLDDGYLPTENIIVLKTGLVGSELLVKEGNRRIAALKLIHGYLPSSGIPIPEELAVKISALPANWKVDNQRVPCAIYPAANFAIVDKIVALTHGKGEQAGRSTWGSVARSRHNRKKNGGGEHGLDLFEKYLVLGDNLNKQQATRWAGNYNLTILDEAIGRIAQKFGAKNGPELARNYPSISHKSALDDIMRDIGVEIVTFPILRKPDFLTSYLQSSVVEALGPIATPLDNSTATSFTTNKSAAMPVQQPGDGASENRQAAETASPSTAQASPGKKVAAVAIGDPKALKRTFKKFTPLGNDRQKVVTLRNEAVKLDLNDNPIAFCFLLRSMFEISAKAYCADHKASGGPSFKKANGDENSLTVVLENITKHLTNNNADQAMVKVLHGAMTELKKPAGILSVTSMNQLVHNPSFSVAANDIATLFGNIFPLLEAMNS